MILMPGLVIVSNSLQRKEDTLHRVWGQQDRLVHFVILALCLFIYPARERERERERERVNVVVLSGLDVYRLSILYFFE